jgi:hypothetical protein
MAIWSISWVFHIFYGHLVYFHRFGILYQDKSGNPALKFGTATTEKKSKGSQA